MTEKTPPSTDRMLEDLARLAKEADGVPEAGLQALATVQRRRSRRLAEIHRRLSDNLEATDPRLVKVDRAFSRARQLERASKDEIKRLKEKPQPSSLR